MIEVDVEKVYQALLGGLVALAAWLGYRRSSKVDEEAHESGTFGGIVGGQNSLIANLQTDNGLLRERIDALVVRVEEQNALIVELTAEVVGLRDSLA